MFLFYLINFIIPKNKNLICLSSFPDYDDQVRALIEFIIANTTGYKIAVLTDNKLSPPSWALHKSIVHHKKYSFSGIWLYMRSRLVFFTHGCFSSLKTVPNQTSINVWHGMPIKNIGRYIDENHRTSNCDYITSTSEFFKEKLSFAFNIPLEKVINLGIPRNDILLKGKNDLIRSKLGNAKNIIAWLPTYRKSVVGEIRLDGQTAKNVFNMPDLDIETLNQSLKDMDIIAVVKPHPMAMNHESSKNINNYSNIKFIDEKWLLKHNTTLYEVMAQSDLLVTDVSSVLIDYLVLERPIICHFPDIDTYKGSRGLIWDFDPNQYAIPIATSQEQLLDALKNNLFGGFDKENLLKLKKLAHDNDSGFTKNLLEFFHV